jgi:hypothetical protein
LQLLLQIRGAIINKGEEWLGLDRVWDDDLEERRG